MARDWVKLHVEMLEHADTQQLPAEAFKLWINLLLLAGRRDDDGVVGRAPDIAYALHMDADELTALLQPLGGRIVADDGVLRVRDWAEWQTKRFDPTAAERQQRYRDAHREDNGESRSVTQSNGTSRSETLEEKRIDKNRGRREDTTPTECDDKSSPTTADWEREFTSPRAAYSGAAIHSKRNGKWLAWYANLVNKAKFSGLSPPEANREFDAYRKSPDWKYAGNKNAVADSWGKWLAQRKRKGNGGSWTLHVS